MKGVMTAGRTAEWLVQSRAKTTDTPMAAMTGDMKVGCSEPRWAVMSVANSAPTSAAPKVELMAVHLGAGLVGWTALTKA